jgi:hypothetical protein
MFRDGQHLYVNSHRDQFPHSERSVSNPHPAFGTPLPFKAKGEGDTSIVDCVAAIGHNVDLWTVFQTLIRVNLSAASLFTNASWYAVCLGALLPLLGDHLPRFYCLPCGLDVR